MRFEKLQKDKKLLYISILIKESFVIKKLTLIKLIIFFTFSNEISFHF